MRLKLSGDFIRNNLKRGDLKLPYLKENSPIKFNFDKIISYPKETRKIVLSKEICNLIGICDLTSIGGVVPGGISWATMLSDTYGQPGFYINTMDGRFCGDVDRIGDKPGVIDDIVVTGKKLDIAIKILKKGGRQPKPYAIFNYGFRNDIPSLFKLDDIMDYIPDYCREEVERWQDKTIRKYFGWRL